MPWTPAQIRLFQAAAHNPAIAASHGMTQDKARQMASEGVRKVTDALIKRGYKKRNETPLF